jgi:nonsense-mediated mRNA decay protein 3
MRTQGLEFSEFLETRVRLKSGSCRDCSRQRGSYFEAIVQLRARKRQPSEEEVDETLELADNIVSSSSSFISKVDYVKGGVDLYMGKVSDGRALAALLSNKYGARTGETKSQAGRKDGKDIYRTTFLVRLPQFGKGDLISYEDLIWEIRSFTKSKVNVEEVSTGRRSSLQMKDLERMPIIERAKALHVAVVVSMSEKEIQVMDPENYKTKDLQRPRGIPDGTKEIKVVRFEGHLHPYLIKERPPKK